MRPAAVKVSTTLALAFALPWLKANDPLVGISTVAIRSGLIQGSVSFASRKQGVYLDENGDAVEGTANMSLLALVIQLLCMRKDRVPVGRGDDFVEL